MNYRFFLLLFLFLNSCVTINVENRKNSIIKKNIFINKGFTTIYSEELYKKKLISNKLEQRDYVIFQKNLKLNTVVKITNLINQKYIIAKVGSTANYPLFFNSVITERIAKELELDKKEPYIEIKEIAHNSSFIAKKAKTFDEEKNVASKAPVDDIEIKDLSNTSNKSKKNLKKKFNYVIKIADFYFEKSALDMSKRIKNETSIKNVNIKKLSSTNFRVLLGPFKNISSLKNEFNAINTLQFDNIEIIRR